MSRKGSCCCGDCFAHDGCGKTGAVVFNFCCKCVPKRVCVKLFTDADYCETEAWSYETPVAVSEASWIDTNGSCSRRYEGVFSFCEKNIDFDITFWKDQYTDECYICLKSDALGYSLYTEGDESVVADRVCLKMGGDYSDLDVKRTECRDMSFVFPVDFSEVFYGGGTGYITIEPADYVQAPSPNPTISDSNLCKPHRICITRINTYGEETIVHTCFDEYVNGWETFFDEEEHESVSIILEEYGDSKLVQLYSYAGDGEQKEAVCPQLYAEWELYDGTIINIRADRQAKCTDCKCYCRCLCVTYQSSDGILERGIACENRNDDGCRTTFNVTLAGNDLEFYLRCDGCEVLSTVLGMNGLYGGTLVTEQELDVLCPNGLEGQWTYQIANNQTATIYVQCVQCGSECTINELGTTSPCCPERETNIPRMLYATFGSSPDCPSLDGAVVPMTLDSPLGATGSCWSGTITVEVFGQPCTQRVTVRCVDDGMGNNVWRISQTECSTGTSSTDDASVISCDPLELGVTFNGVGCCEGGIGAEVGVTVTE